MKWVSIAALVLVVTAFGLWLVYVRAPAPAEVCDHIVEITLQETQAHGLKMESEALVLGNIKESCIKHKLDKIQLRGRIKYATYAKCVVAASDLATIEAC